MIFFHVSFVCFSSFTAAPLCAPCGVCRSRCHIGFSSNPTIENMHEDELVDNNKKRKRVLAGRLCAVSLKRRNKFSHFRQKRAATGLRLVKCALRAPLQPHLLGGQRGLKGHGVTARNSTLVACVLGRGHPAHRAFHGGAHERMMEWRG